MMFFAAQIDERTKKIIMVLCALFIILLLIMGGIYLAIDKYMKKESKKMDTYMYDLLRLKIVTNPRQFRKALNYYEERSLFNNAKWPYRIMFLLTFVALVLTYICFNKEYVAFFTKFLDLIPYIKWTTIGDVNESLAQIPGSIPISGPSWLPASIFPAFISKNPDFTDPMLYASTIYVVFMIMALFSLIRAILAYIARINRGMKMSRQVFEKNLETFDIGLVTDYGDSLNSEVPTK